MTFTLRELALLVGGTVQGDPELPIHGAAILRDVVRGEITLADNDQHTRCLMESAASAVVVPRGWRPDGLASIEVDQVHSSFATIVKRFRPAHPEPARGLSPLAAVSPSATIADGVTILGGVTVGENVSIGNGSVIHPGAQIMAGCRIGENVTIFPNVVLYEDTVIGDRVIIHASAVLGAYGFGYSTVAGQHQLSAQLGNVVVGNDVEIGAGTTIDRGTYGPTTIGDGTKIDNQVMIAHNCRIGRYNMICSQVGIAGSCRTGDYVVMAGQVGLRDHIDIGDRAVLGAKSGVMGSIPSGQVYLGIPATPERQQLLKQAAWAKLPEMRKEFKAMKKRLEQLEQGVQRDAA